MGFQAVGKDVDCTMAEMACPVLFSGFWTQSSLKGKLLGKRENKAFLKKIFVGLSFRGLSFLAGVESTDQCLLNSKVLSCFSGVIMSIRSFFLFSRS